MYEYSFDQMDGNTHNSKNMYIIVVYRRSAIKIHLFQICGKSHQTAIDVMFLTVFESDTSC